MRPIDFCYWLTGFTEITNGQVPDAAQWVVILDHLKLAQETPRLVMTAGIGTVDPSTPLRVC